MLLVIIFSFTYSTNHFHEHLFQYPWRDQKLEVEVEFAQNVVKSIRSIRGDYNLTTKMRPEGIKQE